MRSAEGVKVSLTPQEHAEVEQACERLNCTVPSFFRQVLCYIAACAPQDPPTPDGWPTQHRRRLVQVRLPAQVASRLRSARSTAGLPLQTTSTVRSDRLDVRPPPTLGAYCGAWVMAVLRAPQHLDAALKSTSVQVAPSAALRMSEIPPGGSDGL